MNLQTLDRHFLQIMIAGIWESAKRDHFKQESCSRRVNGFNNSEMADMNMLRICRLRQKYMSRVRMYLERFPNRAQPNHILDNFNSDNFWIFLDNCTVDWEKKEISKYVEIMVENALRTCLSLMKLCYRNLTETCEHVS